MNYVEQRFLNLAENNESCDSWVVQWKLARKRAPKILDLISHVFPHYSLHNASHSEAILNNISIILGREGIDKLSVVDLWMLLNAAYYHDCGMVVDGVDKFELFNEGSAFVEYIKDRQEDISSPMNVYARCLEIKDNKLFYCNNELSAQSYEAVRFLVADFIRGSHATRAAQKVSGEFDAAISGGDIPKRIVRLLACICTAHTQNRESVMDLPFEQTSGCGIEPCHPRFVAFLLRLGDLLDVDNNRLSDVMLHSLGSIPVDSKDYNEVNRSITQLNITRKTIEITAECKNYNIAELTNSWFKWLNDEVIFISQHWYDIAPDNNFGLLPTIGKLEVNLSGYDTIDGKNRPIFKIDTDKAIEMIQGAGLYSNPALCLRELLQNSVDATHLRLFKEDPEKRRDYKTYFTSLKNYPIKVTINEIRLDNDSYECSVEISDRGIGMSKKDLNYLFNTGSSSKNFEKRKLIDRMEDFMRPSGIFGIGFQSVFLLSDKVELYTRKLNREECIKVELNNPAGIEKGAIMIQTSQDDIVPVGTTLKFKTRSKVLGDLRNQVSDKYGLPSYYQYYKKYDFAKARKDDTYSQFAGLIEQVFKFGEYSSVPIQMNYNGSEYYIEGSHLMAYYDEEEGIEVELSQNDTSNIYFRGQTVNHDIFRDFPLLNFNVNILTGSAKQWLSLNRESFLNSNKADLKEKIYRVVAKYLNSQKSSLPVEQKAKFSLILEFLKSYSLLKNINDDWLTYDDSWKDVTLSFNNGTGKGSKTVDVPIGQILGLDEIRYVYKVDYPIEEYIEIEIDGEILRADVFRFRTEYNLFKFVTKKLGEYFSSVFVDHSVFHITKKEQNDVIAHDDETKTLFLRRYMLRHIMARDLIPCNPKYSSLMVKGMLELYPLGIKVPQMVCPFVRIPSKDKYEDAVGLLYDVDEKVIDHVYERRVDSKVTKEQIKATFEEFRNDFQNALEEVNKRSTPDE